MTTDVIESVSAGMIEKMREELDTLIEKKYQLFEELDTLKSSINTLKGNYKQAVRVASSAISSVIDSSAVKEAERAMVKGVEMINNKICELKEIDELIDELQEAQSEIIGGIEV